LTFPGSCENDASRFYVPTKITCIAGSAFFKRLSMQHPPTDRMEDNAVSRRKIHNTGRHSYYASCKWGKLYWWLHAIPVFGCLRRKLGPFLLQEEAVSTSATQDTAG